MRFGVCIPVEQSPGAAAAGWQYVEEIVTDLLQPAIPDSQWTGLARAQRSPLPILAANRLVPASLKITGPHADFHRLAGYMQTAVHRAAAVGIKLLVFGSGPARAVPENFSPSRARDQILEFIRISTDLCAQHDILLLAEPLNRGECNIINSLTEAMQYVRDVNHPSFQCLFDSYHFWLESEPIASLEAAMPSVRHVHLADVPQRRAPGQTGANDYIPIFRVLRQARYDALVTVESNDLATLPDGAARVLNFLTTQLNRTASC